MSEQKQAYDEFARLRKRWEEEAAKYNTAYNDRHDAIVSHDNAAYADADKRATDADGEMKKIYLRMQLAYNRMHAE